MISPIIKEMIDLATQKHFILNIWDACFCDDMTGKPSYSFNVMSDTDIIAIWAFAKETGCPESDMIIKDKGTILEKLYGVEIAYYSFEPIKELV